MILSMVDSHVSVCSFTFLETQKNISCIFIAGFLTNWSAIEISVKILLCDKVMYSGHYLL